MKIQDIIPEIEVGDLENLSETAEFNLIKSVTAVPSKRKG